VLRPVSLLGRGLVGWSCAVCPARSPGCHLGGV